MTSLVKLLNKHGEAIEADLQRHYRIRVADLFHPNRDLTPREVFSYLNYMPEDSAYHAELQGGQQFRGWTIDRYFLAAALDVLQAANYQRGGGKGSKPKATFRPKKKKSGTSLAALAPKRVKRGVDRG